MSVQFACHERLNVDHQELPCAQRFRDKRNERGPQHQLEASAFASDAIRYTTARPAIAWNRPPESDPLQKHRDGAVKSAIASRQAWIGAMARHWLLL
jgi:hypothetical protein